MQKTYVGSMYDNMPIGAAFSTPEHGINRSLLGSHMFTVQLLQPLDPKR